jgi:hypothetical protein
MKNGCVPLVVRPSEAQPASSAPNPEKRTPKIGRLPPMSGVTSLEFAVSSADC